MMELSGPIGTLFGNHDQADQSEILCKNDTNNGRCDSAQLDQMKITHRQLLVGDWLRAGDLGFIFASRGLGKTWLALLLAKGITGGSDVGPWKTHAQAKVFYLDGEMAPEDLQQRDRLLGPPTHELVYLNHEILFQRTGATMNLAARAFQKAILEVCLENNYQVLIADNLSTLSFGIDENKALDWEIILPWLLELRRNHITVIFVHHAGRNNEMRGSSKREDPAFWVIRLDPPLPGAERSGASFISHFTKWRNSSDPPRSFAWNFRPVGACDLCVDFKECSSLSLFLHWVDSGLDSCTDIAGEMEISKGWVAKLAKQAESLGRIQIKGRRYLPVNY